MLPFIYPSTMPTLLPQIFFIHTLPAVDELYPTGHCSFVYGAKLITILMKSSQGLSSSTLFNLGTPAFHNITRDDICTLFPPFGFSAPCASLA